MGLGRIGPNGVIRVVVWTGLNYKGWGFLWVKFNSEKGCLFVAYISPRTKCVKTEISRDQSCYSSKVDTRIDYAKL